MSETGQKRGQGIGFDDFLEDLFGLNWTGLKTIRTLFIAPRDYFRAAEDADWEGRYTPAIRLWLSIVAAIFFLKFFWAGADSNFLASVGLQIDALRAQGVDLSGYADNSEAVGYWVQWYLGIYPFLNFFGYLLLGCVWTAWGGRITIGLRQRYIFATLIPSSCVSFAILILLTMLPDRYFAPISMVQLLVVMMVEAVTAYRGAFPEVSVWGKVWRSILLILALTVVSIATSLIANITAMLIMIANGS